MLLRFDVKNCELTVPSIVVSTTDDLLDSRTENDGLGMVSLALKDERENIHVHIEQYRTL